MRTHRHLAAALVAAALSIPALAAAAAPLQPVGKAPEPRFDRLHDYDEIAQILKDFHTAYPQWTRLESIGKSLEGRDLWLGARKVGVRRPLEPVRAAVDVEHRQDVEDGTVEQLGHPRQPAVVLEHEVDGVEAGLAALHLVRVSVAVDPDRRLRELVAGLRVVDRQP